MSLASALIGAQQRARAPNPPPNERSPAAAAVTRPIRAVERGGVLLLGSSLPSLPSSQWIVEEEPPPRPIQATDMRSVRRGTPTHRAPTKLSTTRVSTARLALSATILPSPFTKKATSETTYTNSSSRAPSGHSVCAVLYRRVDPPPSLPNPEAAKMRRGEARRRRGRKPVTTSRGPDVCVWGANTNIILPTISIHVYISMSGSMAEAVYFRRSWDLRQQQ